MIYIRHRVNRVEDLKKVPESEGVEIDLRDFAGEIVLQHDPFKDGEKFELFLKRYAHAFLILNIKSEGIEEKVLELVLARGIQDFFFLDLSFPAMMKLVRNGENRIAVRYSEFEPEAQALALKGKVKWIWADCFTRIPWTPEAYNALKSTFKICLVSPELQNHSPDWILDFKKSFANYPVDAICTKYPELWK